ncbi:hypothetical protein [Streptosporangium sp. NPDC048865]|uniref:hypothetical protein n=1 Tax=Streptosporangium sp. NPDC048865 TaxID=3155766 RepID=UPI003434C1C4
MAGLVGPAGPETSITLEASPGVATAVPLGATVTVPGGVCPVGTLAVSGEWTGGALGVAVTASEATSADQWSVTFANGGAIVPTVTVSSSCVGPT